MNKYELPEIPGFLRKPKNYKPAPIRKPRKKKVNYEKMERGKLPNSWKDAKYNLIDLPQLNFAKFVFWKPIIKGKNKNKIKYRVPGKARIYLVDKKTFINNLEG